MSLKDVTGAPPAVVPLFQDDPVVGRHRQLVGSGYRMQATGSGHWGLLPTHTADFGPDVESLGPGSSMLGGSDVIAAEVEEVIDLIVG